MIILGLTGSIGMGKSTAAAVLKSLGAAVFDADAAAHQLIGRGGPAVAAVEAAFPGTTVAGRVDRAVLGQRVFGDHDATLRLEAIIHPGVGAMERRFLRLAAARRCPLAVRDVPLLFETGGERRCDAVAVVVAPPFVQAQRVLRRPGMTCDRLVAIRARQMSDQEKVRRADFVIRTGLGKRTSLRDVHGMITMLQGREGRHWPRRARM
ncbi:MAG: dephospho-CoA kinase [Alphaproteobacteria bacterium]|jgi:dephospho-CoA kinase